MCFIMYGEGAGGVQAGCCAHFVCSVASPREGAAWTLVAAPDAASDGLVAEEKEQLHPGKQIAFLQPIDFLIF